MRVIIVGAGWAGCAAAISASKAGGKVTLLERTDMLLGTGLVGGIMRNNGRYTATEEMIALGGGDLFTITDANSRHSNIEFPGHKHASLYDIDKTPSAVFNYLKELKVDVKFQSRIRRVNMDDNIILSVKDDNNNLYPGDVFIDTTGTAGPIKNCIKYGNGCAMCIIRCPSFGGRISLTSLAGIKEYVGKKADGSVGAMSGSCKLFKDSLSVNIINELNTKGVCIIPLPQSMIEDHLNIKACQQYALKEYNENIILLDTGHAKLMAPYFNIDKLHQIPGLEDARYADPYAGSNGNSMRFFSMAPRDNTLKVKNIENLFCAGEKAGLLVGHTEAIVTGTLAGYNSTKFCKRKKLLELPRKLAIGESIAFVNEQMQTQSGFRKKYTYSGSIFFDRMKDLGLYTTNIEEIQNNVANLGLSGIFSKSTIS
ncbi:FAD-dependent oxidoreductase [Clostridium sediminicola]|uniref:FAD-dependent oxidoreductase n=1 Tax=Clostridium sediminicola TaxID=3114879 RepID=UPI0031F27959